MYSDFATRQFCDNLNGNRYYRVFVVFAFPDLAKGSLADLLQRFEAISYLPVFVEVLVRVNPIDKVNSCVS